MVCREIVGQGVGVGGRRTDVGAACGCTCIAVSPSNPLYISRKGDVVGSVSVDSKDMRSAESSCLRSHVVRALESRHQVAPRTGIALERDVDLGILLDEGILETGGDGISLVLGL